MIEDYGILHKAYLKTVPQTYGIVPFDRVVDRNGNSYNSEKGIFTADKNGLYHFRIGFSSMLKVREMLSSISYRPSSSKFLTKFLKSHKCHFASPWISSWAEEKWPCYCRIKEPLLLSSPKYLQKSPKLSHYNRSMTWKWNRLPICYFQWLSF